jgi:putative transposase
LSRVARFRVEPICTVLQVAPSTYYAAKGRAPSARAVSDAVVTPQLVTLWEANYRVYGARKLWKAARRAGIDIGRDNTRRLHGSLGDAPPAELENAFYADQANRKLPVEIK